MVTIQAELWSRMANDERMTKSEAQNPPVCVPRTGWLSAWLDRARDLAQKLTFSSQAEGGPSGKWLIVNLCRPEVCSTLAPPVWP